MRYNRKKDGSYKWFAFTVKTGFPLEIWDLHTCLQDKWGKNQFSTLKESLKDKGFEFPENIKTQLNLTMENISDLMRGKRISFQIKNTDKEKHFITLELNRSVINSTNTK